MVQNQMTPTYPQYTQASLDDFSQTQPTPSSPADQTQTSVQVYSPPAITQNGVEQQTVSLVSMSFSWLLGTTFWKLLGP